MVRASNELAMMVPSEILEETTTHGRAKVISAFIKVRHKKCTCSIMSTLSCMDHQLITIKEKNRMYLNE